MVEAAAVLEAAVERALAGMPERRMAEIVRERRRLGQVLVEPERARQRARDLRDLQRMGEPGAVMVALVKDEDLRLVAEAPEGGGMDDAVAIAAEIVARGARRLGIKPAAASGRDRRRKARALFVSKSPYLARIDLGPRAHLTNWHRFCQ